MQMHDILFDLQIKQISKLYTTDGVEQMPNSNIFVMLFRFPENIVGKLNISVS